MDLENIQNLKLNMKIYVAELKKIVIQVLKLKCNLQAIGFGIEKIHT